MAAEILRALVSVALVSSVAILLVVALRRPLRAWAGARAAYWLWLLVPVLTLASLLPLPTQILQISTESIPAQVRSAMAAIQNTALPDDAPSLSVLLLVIWLAGAGVMFLLMVGRQRAFSRSLGALVTAGDGVHRSAAVATPMLVGAVRPRIIVPLDFESRYSTEEQALVLEHERAHMRRRDVASNALASASLCVFWFNPLMYFAMNWLRADQELACDAHVLRRQAHSARAYAGALLKTQLATEAPWRVPFGCQWQSTHPLRERITMLKRPIPRLPRHLAGIGAAVILAASGGYVAWAGQGAVAAKGPPILVTISVTASDPRTNEVFAAATQYLVHSGEVPEGMLDAKPMAFVCKPFLAADPAAARRWEGMRSQGQAVEPNMISVECELWDRGVKAFTPSFVTEDGRQAVMEYIGEFPGDTESRRYRMEVTATTSSKDIAAAKSSAANH
jgi:beta-lactamase regulating signal transducer with metallopeptidase domain